MKSTIDGLHCPGPVAGLRLYSPPFAPITRTDDVMMRGGLFRICILFGRVLDMG
jgi:hypothetical protein